MSRPHVAERRRLAAAIEREKHAVAALVTERFLERHPDWTARYGEERARRHGVEDALYHLDFLAAAVAAGSPASFAAYAAWAREVLESRGIAVRFLAENLGQIEEALTARFGSTGDGLAPFFRAAAEALAGPAPAIGGEAAAHPLASARQPYLDAALAGRRRAALAIAEEALGRGETVAAVYEHLLEPVQVEVGRLWQTNRISVADEHLATAVTQYVIAQLYPRIQPPQRSLGRVLVTGVAGELHQVGANLVADVLEYDGWSVRFLGTNTPAAAVLAAIQEHRPEVVGLSLTVLANLPALVELADAIRQHHGGHVRRVFVGGAALRHAPDLWRELGLDGCATTLSGARALWAEYAASRGVAEATSVPEEGP